MIRCDGPLFNVQICPRAAPVGGGVPGKFLLILNQHCGTAMGIGIRVSVAMAPSSTFKYAHVRRLLAAASPGNSSSSSIVRCPGCAAGSPSTLGPVRCTGCAVGRFEPVRCPGCAVGWSLAPRFEPVKNADMPRVSPLETSDFGTAMEIGARASVAAAPAPTFKYAHVRCPMAAASPGNSSSPHSEGRRRAGGRRRQRHRTDARPRSDNGNVP